MIDEALMEDAVLAVRRLIEDTEYGDARGVLQAVIHEAVRGSGDLDWGAVFLFNMTPYEAAASIIEGFYTELPTVEADQLMFLLTEGAGRCGSLLKAETMGEA
jgi:hypothetical protein